MVASAMSQPGTREERDVATIPEADVATDSPWVTLVWDDPAFPGDAYSDGDKGLTIYVDGRRFRHQADLSPFAACLPAPSEDCAA